MDDSKRFQPQHELKGILASIVESSDDAILAKDLEGTILTWNRGAERLYGYAASEIVGRPVDVLMSPDHRNELAEIMARIRAGQRVESYETVRMTKAGAQVEVSLTVSPIYNTEGDVVGASAIARDITARKKADRTIRDNEARLTSLVESAVDGIIVIDVRGRIESFNRAAERMFGYAAAEVIGRNVTVLMPSPYREEHDQYLERYLSTGIPHIIGIGREVNGRRKDGSTFPIHLAVGEMVVGGQRKFTGIVHDLTARVQMENQLREQAALVRLGEMAAVIAHEVRNPLAAVRGAVQVIGRRLAADSQEVAVMTEIIARIDALNLLMKDLLLFARPPQPHLATVDVLPLLRVTAALLQQDAAHGEIRVDIVGESMPVTGDPELLKIIFLNLLINSAQAMRGTGVISVSVASAAGSCEVCVSDQGPGIPTEIRDRLFTPFVTTKARGTGLGLSTVKRLIEAHRGAIQVDCPPDGGTIVKVRLPLATSPVSA